MSDIFDAQPFTVTTVAGIDACRVQVAGEVDIETVPQLQQALEDAAASASVVLDLTAVTFIDSSGVRVLVEFAQRNEDGPERFSIVSSPPVDRVIDVTGLRDRLPLVAEG